MKNVLMGVALILAMMGLGCGTSRSNADAINGNWSAALSNSSSGNPTLNFTTTLKSTGSTGVTVTNLTFNSSNACFSGGDNATGAFTLTGTTSGVTSGGFQLTVDSQPAANTLTLTGTLKNNTITGAWTLTGITSGCAGSGNFTMNKS